MRPNVDTTELRKALDSTVSTTGSYLIPEDLERLIRGVLLNLSPLTRMVPMVRANGNIHEIVRRKTLPRGRFEGENPTPTYEDATYDRRQVRIKILRGHGQVTDFLQSAARTFTDVMMDEIMASVEGFADVLEFATMYATSDELAFTGDAKMYPGWYPWLLNDAWASNVIDADGVIELTDLDAALNASKRKFRQTQNDPYVWLASNAMIDKISGLQTRIQRQVPQINFEGNFIMSTYSGVPILPSSFVEPASTTTSPAVTGETSGTGGSLGADTYYYKIASITHYGEQIAGTASGALPVGASGTAAFAWAADTNALLYAVYRSDTTDADDSYKLIDIINALTYTSDKPSGYRVSYTDNGTKTAMTTVHPLAAGESILALVNLNQERGLSRVMLQPTLGDPVDEILRYVKVTENTDTHQWRLKTYHAIQVPWGNVHAVIRRAKTA